MIPSVGLSKYINIRYNRMHGLSLDPSLLDPLKHPCIGSLITSNIIEFNTLDGIRMGNCDNGFIRSNTSQSNGRCNAYQGGGSTGNIWTGNILQNWCGTVPEQH